MQKDGQKYSGIPDYPGTGLNLETDGTVAIYAYDVSFDKWVGKYGVLRYELLDFVIEELKRDIENEKDFQSLLVLT